MKVLITGAEGFVGPYLLEALVSAGHDAVGTSQHGSTGPALDLLESRDAARVIDEIAPDAVVHLAAVSAVPAAAKDPDLAWRVNVEGVRRLSSAFANRRPDGVFLFVSTGAVYGASGGGVPIDETHPRSAANSYASTKVAAEAWLEAQTLADDRDRWPRTVIARPFNHVGAGQGSEFALAGFARQIAEGERQGNGAANAPIRVATGNLDVRRDFLDVRDVVSAYVSLLETEAARGVFNICSGESHRIGDLLDRLIERTPCPVEVVTESARLRLGDRDGVLASCQKLREVTGWKPQVNLADTLSEILEDWRERVGSPIGAD